MRHTLNKIWLTALLLSCNIGLFAQEEAPSVTLADPQNTVWVHLYYLQPESYEPKLAAAGIHPSVLDTARAIELAVQIKQIYDTKGLYVQVFDIPTDPNYIDSTSNQARYIPFPKRLPNIYLEKVDGSWYYSKETIQQTPHLYQELFPFGTHRLVQLLPRFGQHRFLGLAGWQWLGLGLLIVLIGVLHFILSRLLRPLVRRVSRSRLHPSLIEPKLTWKIARLISFLLLFQLARALLPVLLLPIGWSQFLVIGLRVATILLFMLVLLRILDVFMLYGRKYAEGTESRLDEQFIPIMRRMLQVLIVIGAIVQILRLMEFNVTALIAGVSIGGLALALAAQDTVKNLIGSAMIFVDKPFQIGDWIEGSDFAGTVVEVGFRTTRILRVDSSIVSVPNGTIANVAITNLGVRAFRLMNIQLGLVYSTPPALIEQFIEGLREMIAAHPNASTEASHVYLNNMGASDLGIMFRCPLEVPDYQTELRVKQEIYLGILRLAEYLDISFAFPSTSVYMEPMDQESKQSTPKSLEKFLEQFKKEIDRTDA